MWTLCPHGETCMPADVRSLAKALTVLESLASSHEPMSALALSRRLKYPRATLYRILQTLCRHDFVRREGPASFRLGFKVLDLGNQLLEGTDLLGAARPALRQLGAEVQETVHLAIPHEGRMVYLDKLEGSGPFCTHSRPGLAVPMHCTALGKAVLAFLPEDRAHAILRGQGMLRHTRRTLVSVKAMDREMARVRRLGYAIDDVEFERDVRCVGAPILDHRGQPVAAMSVSAPVSRMPLSRAHALGLSLRRVAARVSRALGWRPSVGPGRVTGNGGVGRRGGGGEKGSTLLAVRSQRRRKGHE
jgi:DNA-binding IclR family transcriptional regulator